MGIRTDRGLGVLNLKVATAIAKGFEDEQEKANAQKMIAQVDTYWAHYRSAAPGPNPLRTALNDAPAYIDEDAVRLAKAQGKYESTVRYFFGDTVAQWAHDIIAFGSQIYSGDGRYDQKWIDQAVALWTQTFAEGFPPYFVDLVSPLNPDQLKNDAMRAQAAFRSLPIDQATALRDLWTSTQALATAEPIATMLAYGAGGAFVDDRDAFARMPEAQRTVPCGETMCTPQNDALQQTVRFAVFASRVFGRAYNVADPGALDVVTMRRVRKEVFEYFRDSGGDLIPIGDELAPIPRAGHVALIAQQEAKARARPSTLVRTLAKLLAASEAEKKRTQARRGAVAAGLGVVAVVAGCVWWYRRS